MGDRYKPLDAFGLNVERGHAMIRAPADMAFDAREVGSRAPETPWKSSFRDPTEYDNCLSPGSIMPPAPSDPQSTRRGV